MPRPVSAGSSSPARINYFSRGEPPRPPFPEQAEMLERLVADNPEQ